jgi:hypothetical protein
LGQQILGALVISAPPEFPALACREPDVWKNSEEALSHGEADRYSQDQGNTVEQKSFRSTDPVNETRL